LFDSKNRNISKKKKNFQPLPFFLFFRGHLILPEKTHKFIILKPNNWWDLYLNGFSYFLLGVFSGWKSSRSCFQERNESLPHVSTTEVQVDECQGVVGFDGTHKVFARLAIAFGGKQTACRF